MNPSVVLLCVAILVVGILIFVATIIAQKHGHHLNKDSYQADWLAIENALSRDNLASYQVAIMDADKLLDHALKELRVPGKTMGERLKHSGGRFSQLNDVWAAHKLRNKIAHETGVQPSYDQTKRALISFKRALKDLGAI